MAKNTHLITSYRKLWPLHNSFKVFPPPKQKYVSGTFFQKNKIKIKIPVIFRQKLKILIVTWSDDVNLWHFKFQLFDLWLYDIFHSLKYQKYQVTMKLGSKHYNLWSLYISFSVFYDSRIRLKYRSGCMWKQRSQMFTIHTVKNTKI